MQPNRIAVQLPKAQQTGLELDLHTRFGIQVNDVFPATRADETILTFVLNSDQVELGQQLIAHLEQQKTAGIVQVVEVIPWEEHEDDEEDFYAGNVEVELTGLAMMRQRRTMRLSKPLSWSSVEALAKETEGNHVWDYQGMREETIEVMILGQHSSPQGQHVPGEAVRNQDTLTNHQREQDEKLQPTSKWVPLKVHDNTVDIAIQRLQATVDQYQQYLSALNELLAMTQHREFGSREATAYLHKFVQWQVGLEREEIESKILAVRWEIIQLSARDEKSQWPHYKVEYGFEPDHFADAQFTYIPVKMVEHFGGVEEAFHALGLLQNEDGEKAIILGDIDTTSLYTPDGEEYIVPTHDFEWASFFTGGEALAGDSTCRTL